MEELIFKGVETTLIGALFYVVLKEGFKYLGGRSTRNDEREKEMIELQRESQKIISNHLPHMETATDRNTQALDSLKDVVSSCALVQESQKIKKP